MRRLFPDLLKGADGVYQPLPPMWLSAVRLCGGVVAGVLVAYKGGPWMSSVALIGLAIGIGVRDLLAWHHHGPRGQPLVRVVDGRLMIRHADKKARDFEIPLVQVAHLVIYGAAGRRTFRFIQHDGSWREAWPERKPRAEALVIEFLRERLRERVVVEESQTGFAQVRGDGPYFGS